MYNSLPSSLSSELVAAPETPSEHGGESSKNLNEAKDDGILYQLERKGILKLTVDEIKRCQRLSAGPNFVVTLIT